MKIWFLDKEVIRPNNVAHNQELGSVAFFHSHPFCRKLANFFSPFNVKTAFFQLLT